MFINLRNKPQWFLDLVPKGLVPVAKIKDKLLPESYDILKVNKIHASVASISEVRQPQKQLSTCDALLGAATPSKSHAKMIVIQRQQENSVNLSDVDTHKASGFCVACMMLHIALCFVG